MHLQKQLKKYIGKFYNPERSRRTHLSSPKGFTIVEFLLYMGLMAILLTALTGILGTILDANTEAKSTATLDEDGRFILARLSRDVQTATTSAAPIYNQPAGNTLQLTGTGMNYTYSLDAPNGNLRITNNTTSTVDNLNSVDASVSAVTFQRLGTGGSSDSIQAKFTLTSRIQRKGGVYETKNFQTTIGLE